MRALVTGGCGFIGSTITDHLIKRGFDVVVVDNLSAGLTSNLNPKAKFINGDIRDRNLMGQLCSDIDLLFHCAVLLPVIKTPLEDYSEHEDVNVTGTLNLFQSCIGTRLKKFVFASTCAVYGQAKNFPIHENTPAELQTRPYTIHKFSCEEHLKLMSKRHDVPFLNLRYFATYGGRSFNEQKPNNAYSPVVGIFARQFLNNQPLTVTGDGSQSRDFIHVDDVARMTIEAGLSDCSGETFNICSGNNISILELAKMISDDIKFVERHVGEVDKIHGDNSKIKNLLGLVPEVTLTEGIKKLLVELSV